MRSALVGTADRIGAGRPAGSLADLVDALGLTPSLPLLTRRLVGRKWLVLVKALEEPLPEIPAIGSLTWTPLTEAELVPIRAMDPAMTEEEVRRRWREGQSCLLCWVGGTLAHYRWEATGPTYLPALGKVFWPQDGDRLSVDVLTDPAFRGRGINTVGLISAMHRAKEQGFARLISMVPPWNVRSLQVSLHKAERAIAGAVGYWGAGPMRRYQATGAVVLERGGLSVRRHGDRPGLPLRP